jgi:hypothetical protein
VAAPSADPLIECLIGLRTGDPAPVRRALQASPDAEPALAALLLPLLARDDLFPDVLRALRRAAPRITGQLVDALLDTNADPVVRRRIPRVLKACPTPRAADGLRLALDDPAFDVRAAASAARAALHERSSVVDLPRYEVLARVRRELDSGEPVDRQLPQLFALLSLTLERGPLQIAWAAMKGQDRALFAAAAKSGSRSRLMADRIVADGLADIGARWFLAVERCAQRRAHPKASSSRRESRIGRAGLNGEPRLLHQSECSRSRSP